MIKSEIWNGTSHVELSGSEPHVLNECLLLLTKMKDTLTELKGEEYARDVMDAMYENVWMSDEEIDADIKRMEAEDPELAAEADALLEEIFGGIRPKMVIVVQRRNSNGSDKF